MAKTLEEGKIVNAISYHQANSGLNLRQAKPKSLNILKQALHRVKSIEDENNNEQADGFGPNLLKAARFKYVSNATRAEIEHIRALLALQREQQVLDEPEWSFFRSDYERMMADDWLVTRFLLRGRKASYRQSDPMQQPRHRVASDLYECKGDEMGDLTIYDRTMELIGICARFRYDYKINALTQESEFPLEWTEVNGMFHYKHDRAGNPIVYMRVALHRPKLIDSPELRHQFYRYMLFVLEQCDRDLFQKPGKAICCIFDMTNVAFENIDLELTNWMIKSFKSCAPKLLCYVVVYNPPWFFMATFKIICNTLLSNSKRQSIKFAHGEEILDYIDKADLPSYLQERFVDTKR